MPAKRLADTNELIRHFRRLRPYGERTPREAEQWARSYIKDYNAVIIAPIEIEFLVGIVDGHEMELALAYLRPFPCVDRRETRPEDWDEARRIAKHIGRDAGRRQLCDCLIIAVAARLRIDTISSRDKGLHRQRGQTRQRRP